MRTTAVIEIPEGQRYKYELKKGKLILDRVLDHRLPSNYGYIKGTLAQDKDALDVFVITNEALLPTAEAAIDIIGGFECTDNGVKDEKLVALLAGREFNSDATKILEVRKIRTYLSEYKPGFVVDKELTKEEALKVFKKYKK